MYFDIAVSIKKIYAVLLMNSLIYSDFALKWAPTNPVILLWMCGPKRTPPQSMQVYTNWSNGARRLLLE